MRQLINRLVAETAGDIEVREYRNARYLLRPGHSLEHQFFARLAPGVAKLKIEGFCLQWNAKQLERDERCVVLLAPFSPTFWQRMTGIKPGLKIQIDVPPTSGASAVSKLRVFIQPVHCDREAALAIMEEAAPELMDSLRTYFQAQPEQRRPGAAAF